MRVGFVFAASKRQVTAAQVREIVRELPATVERVGVFAGASADEIVRAVEEAGLTGVQLHGGLDLRLAEELAGALGGGVEVIHTVHWVVGEDEASARQVSAEMARLAELGDEIRVLVDAKVGAASGGLGVAFSWERARGVLGAQAGLRVIVAGGLRPETVSEAVRVLRPWGVDVASGVEERAGKKDWAKVAAFVQEARGGAAAGA